MPHHLRGDRKEVRAILPVDVALIDQLHISLVDQAGRLQRAVAAFVRHVARGDHVELVVDERDQAIERRAVAVLPLAQQHRDLCRRRWGLAVHGFLGCARFCHGGESRSKAERR